MARQAETLDTQAREEIRATAHALADAARSATLRHFRRRGLERDNKDRNGGFDPVTAADREAESAIRTILHERRPEDGILGEEFAPTPSRSGLTWIIDPIDGTRGFISGTPTWGVLIAIADEAGPFHGIIDQPYIGERFAGGLGEAHLAGPMGEAALATSRTERIEDAILFTTFPEIGTADERLAFESVAAHCRLVRYGMDCYAYGLLAAGHVDLVIEAGLNPYDIAAPIAVIEAAGGVVTNWQGEPAHEGGRVLAAANPVLHARALALVQAALD